MKKILEYLIEFTFLILGYYFFVYKAILGILAVPYYSEIHLTSLYFTLFILGVFLVFLIYFIIRDKKSVGVKYRTVFNRIRQSKYKWFILATIMSFFINIVILHILYPTLLISSSLVTNEESMIGIVVNKKEYTYITQFTGRTSQEFKSQIDELTIKNSDGHIKKFNIQRYNDLWEAINIGDKIKISFYPFIRDNYLAIKILNPNEIKNSRKPDQNNDNSNNTLSQKSERQLNTLASNIEKQTKLSLESYEYFHPFAQIIEL